MALAYQSNAELKAEEEEGEDREGAGHLWKPELIKSIT